MLPGMAQVGGIRGGPVTLTYETSASDTSNVAAPDSYTFSSVDIGTAHANRLVIVALQISGAGSVSVITIGGVTATKHTFVGADIYSAIVPTGATGDIVVTVASGTVNKCGIGVWTLNNYQSRTPTSTGDTASAGADTSVAETIHIQPGGIAVASLDRIGTGGNTWTTATERFDAIVEDASFSGADYTAPSGASALSISCSFSSSTFRNIGIAAWR